MADVRTGARVRPQVLHELSAAGEPFPAVLAVVRFVSGVNPQVQPEAFFDGENFLAIIAHVNLGTLQSGRVLRGDMVFEAAGLPEAPFALAADEGSFVCVYAEMFP